MELRRYTGADAEATLSVFLRAIRETAADDYSPDQVAAWAAEHGDMAAWAASRQAAHTQVATIDGRVAGFTDLDDDGYVDMLFVDPDVGRRGVAAESGQRMIFASRRPSSTWRSLLPGCRFLHRSGELVKHEAGTST